MTLSRVLFLLTLAAATACTSNPSVAPSPTPTDGTTDPSPSPTVGAELAAAAAAAGCSDPEAFPTDDSTHVPEGEISYDRYPPEGGAHRPNWSDTGIHDEPIEDETQVHNLEHGHVGLQGAEELDIDLIEVLATHAEDQPEWIFVAPYENFQGDTVLSLTAWGHRVDCGPGLTDPQALDDLVEAFLDEHMDNAPESVPGVPTA